MENVVSLNFKRFTSPSTQASKAKKFLHDVKSPIQTLNLIDQGKLDHRDDKKEIRSLCVNQIKQLVNSLEDKNTKAITADTSLAKLLNQVKKEKSTELGIDITISCEHNIAWLKPRINDSDFKRIISNLINNSFNSNQNCSVSLYAKKVNGQIRISIIDNSKGICATTLNALGDYGHSQVNKGQGIGLSSAVERLNKAGGHLTCRSIQGLGTSFSIFLPL